jgi:hypothetical protein
MTATLKTRKRVDKLTLADFVAFPIWEFASDEEGVEGQDETWVRPVHRNQVPARAYSQLVASDFTTASGAKIQGFMVVTTAEKSQISAGSLIGDGSYLVLPNMSEQRAREEGLVWARRSRKHFLNALGSTAAKVFPIAYTLRVRIRGENTFRSGVVE